MARGRNALGQEASESLVHHEKTTELHNMVKLTRMSLADATFLHVETRDTPGHVAGLMIFKLPQDASADFVKQLVKSYRAEVPFMRPWNLTLVRVPFSRIAPAVVELAEHEIDLTYHVRHTALPDPGGERELGELVSHLHSQTLDRSRPLWTCHVIEGLENDRFALYIKIHHALTDGVNGIRMMSNSLATSPDGFWRAPWHAVPDDSTKRRKHRTAGTSERLPLTQWPKVIHRALAQLRDSRIKGEPVLLPFEAPPSLLNGQVTAARRIATQQLDLGRIKSIAKRTGTSVNDVFLTICSSALRQHLRHNNALPERSLIACVPVSLKEPGDEGGNAVGFLWTTLATDHESPAKRLGSIAASMNASKLHLKSLPRAARTAYTMATMAPTIGLLMSGAGARVKPPMNLIISNVPGPEHDLFLNGARMEALYPISTPLQGQALNITCISYGKTLGVGFTGSRDSMPKLQKIAVYAGEALDELEQAIIG